MDAKSRRAFPPTFFWWIMFPFFLCRFILLNPTLVLVGLGVHPWPSLWIPLASRRARHSPWWLPISHRRPPPPRLAPLPSSYPQSWVSARTSPMPATLPPLPPSVDMMVRSTCHPCQTPRPNWTEEAVPRSPQIWLTLNTWAAVAEEAEAVAAEWCPAQIREGKERKAEVKVRNRVAEWTGPTGSSADTERPSHPTSWKSWRGPSPEHTTQTYSQGEAKCLTDWLRSTAVNWG